MFSFWGILAFVFLVIIAVAVILFAIFIGFVIVVALCDAISKCSNGFVKSILYIVLFALLVSAITYGFVSIDFSAISDWFEWNVECADWFPLNW